MIRNLTFLVLAIFVTNFGFAQEIKVSDNLTLSQLSEHCYVHTQKNNNGLVFVNNGEALIVSTPDNDTETQQLIDWVRNEKHATIVAYVIDRWHPDAMGGLKTVQQNGIKNYACELTRKIAKEKDLPIPEEGFKSKKKIKVGGEKVLCHYLGEAHTTDGIVVYVPSEKVLFGGNEIRNYEGWVGNISDANLDKWSETASNIKKKYGKAKIVVPGHGKYGGSELIDYTIELYKNVQNQTINHSKQLNLDYKTANEFYAIAKLKLQQNDKQVLKNAVVIAQDSFKYVVIESSEIVYQSDKKMINSANGRVKVYDKKPNGETLRTDVCYKNLSVYRLYETIGFLVVLREFEK